MLAGLGPMCGEAAGGLADELKNYSVGSEVTVLMWRRDRRQSAP